jgi:hypothetical protein
MASTWSLAAAQNAALSSVMTGAGRTLRGRSAEVPMALLTCLPLANHSRYSGT